MTKKIPNPGSDAAIKQGCICPAITNNHGKGDPNGTFWINCGCPIHGIPERVK